MAPLHVTDYDVINDDDRDEMVDLGNSPIQHFFTGTRVFITGGTGFMGQVLLEKLLRSCPGIEQVFLMIRPKKGKGVEERLEEIFQGPLFSRLHSEVPKFRAKITLVSGDCSNEGLGLSPEDREVLAREVHVVFHVAATVRFNEKLKVAVSTNVRGTKLVLELAKKMNNLKALVHVSTAYANCPIKDIDEKFYQPGADDIKLEALCDCLNDDQIAAILPSVIGEWPNTYAFTKATAEDCIRKYAQGLPIAIVRPSIVISTAYEPIEGWINNLYGAMGVSAGAAVGLLKSLYCDKDIVADVIPVDMSINCCISAAWDVGRTRSTSETNSTNASVPIYNYVSSTERPITWGQYMTYAEQGLDFPLIQCIWYYCFTLNRNRYVHNLYVVFLHLLPAVLVDTAARLVGKEPVLSKAYEKVHKFSDVIAYFTMQHWRFRTDNVQRLWRRLGPRDQQLFNFNVATLDWKTMMLHCALGLRQYIFKESMDNIVEARWRFQKFKMAHYAISTTVVLLILRLLYWIACLFI